MYSITLYSARGGDCISHRRHYATIDEVKRLKHVKNLSRISKFYVDNLAHCSLFNQVDYTDCDNETAYYPSTSNTGNDCIMPTKVFNVVEDYVQRISFRVSIHYHNPFSTAKMSTFAFMSVACDTLEEYMNFLVEFPIQPPFPGMHKPNYLTFSSESKYILSTTGNATRPIIPPTKRGTTATLGSTCYDDSCRLQFQTALIENLNGKIDALNNRADIIARCNG